MIPGGQVCLQDLLVGYEMDSESATSSSSASSPVKGPDGQSSTVSGQDRDVHDKPSMVSAQDKDAHEKPSILSPSGISSWAKNLKITQPLTAAQKDPQGGNDGMLNFARFTNGFGLRLPTKASKPDETVENNSKTSTAENSSTTSEKGLMGSFRKGLVDSSMSAVKAVQVKARHIVSQNKRRYQEGGFDLDLTYITDNIIAMGFPAGDMSSGFFGYIEGFYRNHMEEVIDFFETKHKGKYKVYNLCSERLYDASLFKGKVASFPFDDHNCPPIQLILSFCQSASSWLKEDDENVVVVHCKAGMARTGLMISSLLLYTKFSQAADEAIDHYNEKRCLDGKGLVLPSQIRYVKYFEHVLNHYNGEVPHMRRCMLRGFRLHKCPFWIRPSITISNHKGVIFSTQKHPKTKSLMPEDFWINARKKGFLVFALPGEPGLTELIGDFKIHFHDRQGDFYCWLNTSMMENRKLLSTSDLDGFDKRLPSPGFQVEVVIVDYNGTMPTNSTTETTSNESVGNSSTGSASGNGPTSKKNNKGSADEDDVFSDSDSEEKGSTKRRQAQATLSPRAATSSPIDSKTSVTQETKVATHGTEHSLPTNKTSQILAKEQKTDGSSSPSSDLRVSKLDSAASDIKAIAADASVFSFGDEDDDESE